MASKKRSTGGPGESSRKKKIKTETFDLSDKCPNIAIFRTLAQLGNFNYYIPTVRYERDCFAFIIANVLNRKTTGKTSFPNMAPWMCIWSRNWETRTVAKSNIGFFVMYYSIFKGNTGSSLF